MASRSGQSDAGRIDAQPESRALSPEASHFLVQLSIALAKVGTYPPAHPALETAVRALTLRLERVLAERESVSIGVARDRLVVEGGSTDPSNALLRGLAQSLHRHQIGAVSFSRGASPAEVSALLFALASDPQRSVALGAMDPDELARWPNIGLLPVALDELELADGAARSTRAEQLWLALASATMRRGPGEAPGAGPASAALADAIRSNANDATYDRVIADYMRRVGQELVDRNGSGTPIALQMGDLLSSLGPETMKTLLELGSDLTTRSELVRDMSRVLPPRSVIVLTRAAADASKQAISHSLLRLFTKMAANAESGASQMSAASDLALRDAIAQMVDGWTLEDPNPERYRGLLVELARTSQEVGQSTDNDAWVDALRIVELSVETGALGPAVWRCVDELLDFGRLEELLAILDTAPSETTAQAMRTYVAEPDRVRRVFACAQSRQSIDRVLGWTKPDCIDALLDSLAIADSRATRRQIIARLVGFGSLCTAPVLRRLETGQWYVQRNMLYILSELEEIPPGFVPRKWLEDTDVRIRREAIKLALRMTEWRPQAIATGLDDTDARILGLVLGSALEDGSPTFAAPIIRLLAKPGIDLTVRTLAVQVLGRTRTPEGRDWLVTRAAGRRRWWQPGRIAPKSAETLAAIAALREQWPDHARVTRTLRRARRSPDPDIRAAAEGIAA